MTRRCTHLMNPSTVAANQSRNSLQDSGRLSALGRTGMYVDLEHDISAGTRLALGQVRNPQQTQCGSTEDTFDERGNTYEFETSATEARQWSARLGTQSVPVIVLRAFPENPHPVPDLPSRHGGLLEMVRAGGTWLQMCFFPPQRRRLNGSPTGKTLTQPWRAGTPMPTDERDD